ncbi:MAG: ImmA/IrrE family metallo-endopeptidase [Tissierellaceae bacterium]
MTNNNRIEIPKEIYLWAIKESKKDLEEIKLKFKNIEMWISKEILPTYRQIEQLANYLRVPLGYMFLNKPPKTDIIQTEFRTIGNKVPEVSTELRDTLYNIGRKRDWLSDYRKKKGWEKLVPDELLNLGVRDTYDISTVSKEYLELNEFWYKDYKNNREAFDYLRRKLENKGITVMQNGVVGTNNHRKLNINEFRGFLLYDELAPIIFINNNDSPTGKIFTLIHEYIHFLLQEDDILTEYDVIIDNGNETEINKITAEFLMPISHIKELWDDSRQGVQQVEELSKVLHVSMIALAIRLKNMDKINQKLLKEIEQYTKKRWEDSNKETSSGGNYYYTSRSRFGDSFLTTVVQGTESGDISYTDAFRLLDNSVKTYDYFKEECMNYGR